MSLSRPICAAVIALLGFTIWLSDSITPKGQRTVFTADCEQGPWQGHRCRGKLISGRRYVFQTVKNRGEVLFWTIGGSGPPGRYTACVIRDGRDWSCKPNEDAAMTITHELDKGLPVPDASGSTIAFHQIPKWKWLLARCGLPAGDEAMT